MEGKLPQPLIYNDFSGGYVSNVSAFSGGNTHYQRARNVCSIEEMTIQKRSGRTEREDTGYGQNNGAIYYDFINGGEQLVTAQGTAIYSQSSATGSFTSRLTGGTNSMWEFEPFGSYLLGINEDDKQLYAWNGTDANFSSVGGAPNGTILKTFYSYNFMAGISTTPSSVRYSAAGDHTSWPAANIWPISSNEGGTITAMEILGERLYVFKDNSIHRVTYLGGVPLLETKKIADIGTESPRSVKRVFWKDRYYLVFLGTDKNVYMFDGYNPPINLSRFVRNSNPWGDISLEDADESHLDEAYAVFYKKQKWYCLFFRPKQDSQVDFCMVLDLSRDNAAWYPFDGQNLRNAIEFGNDVLAFDYNGKILNWFTGDDDDGEDIYSYYETPFITQWTGSLTEVQFIQFIMKSTSQNIRLGYKVDYDDDFIVPDTTLLAQSTTGGSYLLGSTFVLGTSTLGGSAFATIKIDAPVTVNNLRVRVSDNSSNPAWKLYNINIYLKNRGIGDSYGTY